MRSLRANLLLSAISPFVVIFLVGFFLLRFFINKDATIASSEATQIHEKEHSQVEYLSKSWVIYRFIQAAAELDAVSNAIHIENKSPWEIAGSMLAQDPYIAVIQVTDPEHRNVVVSSEGAQAYTPLWARDHQDRLWIKIPEKEAIFLATQEKNDYALTPAQSEETLSFIPFEKETVSFSLNDSTEEIYNGMRLQENQLFEKIKMIRQLLSWQGKAAGILQVDPAFKKGTVILTEEAISTVPIIDAAKPILSPFVLYRNEGPSVDLVQLVPRASKDDPTVIIGYSLSLIAKQIAKGLQKPVLLSNDKIEFQGFTPEGENIPLNALTFNSQTTVWQGNEYTQLNVPLGNITFSFLYPKAETLSLFHLMHQVRDRFLNRITWNLVIIALPLLAYAFLAITLISRRITKPITQLALASDAIGQGKFEEVKLPRAEKRHDEVATLTRAFQKMVVSLQEREKIRNILNKVVSKEIASKILSGDIELGGEERTLTMLFSDIRGFTHLSETLPPHHVLTVLNEYMTRMCFIIDQTHGVVDKFVGDEIMALYGAPIDMENHAENTLEAALLMIDDLNRWNSEQRENKPPITVGIGIHTGIAVAGNMGAQDRLNYTVVGANVNLAARLCSAAESMQILVSEETYRALKNPQKFHFEKLPPISLKGIEKPVSIYAVSKRKEKSFKKEKV